jgi:DNA-directed RNA polymerase subunit F
MTSELSTHDLILEQLEIYHQNNIKFEEKFNKAAGTRARKALNELVKLARTRRKEIQDKKKESE